ncbi:MAG: TonB-dependent vitamin B12 receptor [Gammaproteobacteria bacterium]|nr:TonB-dependent vitamin B12 receptor [Gammaproteobacteria bacterium]
MFKCSLPAALSLLAFHPLYAADPGIEAPAIVVTATRTARTVDETLASVTVITRRDIERQQARSVDDLLRGELGVSISNNGGPGKTTSVFLRGTESDHVLVLIDGIKVGSATTGTAAFQDMPVDQIERIEIVRGPRSSLYGSEAIGGVIQIFTRKGEGPMTPSFSLGGGSYKTYNTSVGVSGGIERGWLSFNASDFSTNGINACSGKPSPGGAGCFTYEPDKDGYRNASGSLRAGYRFDKGSDIDLHWLRTEAHNEYDGSTNEANTIQEVYGAQFHITPMDPWRITLGAGRSRDDSDNLKNGVFKSRFDTDRNTASFQNDFTINPGHIFTVGYDYQDDRIGSTTNYAVTSRDNRGLFVQHQANLDAHNMQISLRRDENEQFGQHDTGSLAWGYRVSEQLRLTASFGTAFKAPTFNELYFPGYGNPNIGPETSRSAEIGGRGSANWGHWSLTTFQTKIDDLIAYDASINAASNVEAAYIHGLETKLGSRFAGWDTGMDLTLLKPENRSSGANYGKILPRRAEQVLRLGAERGFGAYRLGATLNAEGRRYDDLANKQVLGGYTTVDLHGEYTLARNWLAQARIVNLLDKNYETAAYYNQPGRSFFMTLRYQPDYH